MPETVALAGITETVTGQQFAETFYLIGSESVGNNTLSSASDVFGDEILQPNTVHVGEFKNIASTSTGYVSMRFVFIEF